MKSPTHPQTAASEGKADLKISPMMAQWHTCKKATKDALLLFRMGDFYEAFYDDAVVLAKELNLTLTKRQEIPMSGVPCHTSDSYVDKLVHKGYHVAIAEQTEDPKKAKGLVKREVVRVVTPGTIVNSALLSEKTNNFFASIAQVNVLFGLAFLDLTTAEFRVIEFENERELLNEIYRIRPVEMLVSEKFQEKQRSILEELQSSHSFLLNTQEEWHFDHQATYEFLLEHFKVHTLDGFGLKGMAAGIKAAGALLAYIQEHLSLSIEHIQEVTPYSTLQYMCIDRTTQCNLELTESLQDGSRKNTLLEVLDRTQTPMGGRLLRHWVKQPLICTESIKKRQEAIQALFSHPSVAEKLGALLCDVRDLERLIMKISSGYASPRDLVSLRFSFEPIPEVKTVLSSLPSSLLQEQTHNLDTLPEMTTRIAEAIVDDPPLKLGDGRTFRDGYHKELDELREISRNSKSWIARYQNQLKEELGIKTLKVGFNKMFGYYIEVSKGQVDRMPETFQRRQTLVNAERYITPELKDYEEKVMSAEERITTIENQLFVALRQEVTKYTQQVLKVAHALANIDCLNALAEAALQHDYICPTVDNSQLLHITEGRHPVIEAANLGEKFIPNDTLLDDQDNRLLLITGPNMAGKSTYIRQVALVIVMAQIGSFVPAKSAHIGIVDKVFTRIGASDDLSRGQSTFMVEMTETANILNNATSRSLVVLDEIGRGTSTYDGISIAWAVAEHLLTTEGKTAKTLFATHYWELTKLEEKIPGAVNYNVAVREYEDQIIFLRKIIKGGTDKSYGIHVARLAGLPPLVISRAKTILAHLEENANRKGVFERDSLKNLPTGKKKTSAKEVQFVLFHPKDKQPSQHDACFVHELEKLDLDHLTPTQAHAKLAEIKEMLTSKTQ